jgi:hypothetical protein
MAERDEDLTDARGENRQGEGAPRTYLQEQTEETTILVTVMTTIAVTERASGFLTTSRSRGAAAADP